MYYKLSADVYCICVCVLASRWINVPVRSAYRACIRALASVTRFLLHIARQHVLRKSGTEPYRESSRYGRPGKHRVENVRKCSEFLAHLSNEMFGFLDIQSFSPVTPRNHRRCHQQQQQYHDCCHKQENLVTWPKSSAVALSRY